MFKKPLSNLKTSAPLRSSDRRKLKQKVISTFDISPDDGDLLVPDGVESLKFSTYLEEPGLVYLSAEGDPLWFTIGKGSEDLIPTTYTLWKKGDILPFLSTPSAVIPVLTGGADLMIPGVVHHAPGLAEGQLVCIRQYSRKDGQPQLSVPLAVGRMALSSDQLSSGGKEKGKAVHILHAWRDHLWDMGSKLEIPEDKAIQIGNERPESSSSGDATENKAPSNEQQDISPGAPQPEPEGQPNDDVSTPLVDTASYTPQEITELLQTSLIQAIAVSLSSVPAKTFPIPSTQFYTSYILPSRPAYPATILPPSSAPQASASSSTTSDGPGQAHVDPQQINIKASSHKSLTTFLKAAEKLSLLTVKPPQKHSQHTDLLITSVNAKHPLVEGHTPFPTVGDIERRAAKRAEREEREKEAGSSRELEIRELCKPHQSSVDLFKGIGGDTGALYTATEIRSLLFDYVASRDLVNKRDKAYINLDGLLVSCFSAKAGGKSKRKEADPEPSTPEFLKRDELVKQVMAKMQSWYEVTVPGKDPVQKKGALSPIQVVMKVRQGRKASTLITGFEPFLVINGEEMAEDLRKTCAGATSVSPAVGKPAGSSLEVLVQGKQSSAIVNYLTGKGIPKRWIEVADRVGKK